MRKVAIVNGTCLGVSALIAATIVVIDAWLNNTMGEYYNPTDVWGTMKWGYAGTLVVALTAAFFTASIVLAAVGGVLSLLFDRRRGVRE